MEVPEVPSNLKRGETSSFDRLQIYAIQSSNTISLFEINIGKLAQQTWNYTM